MTDATKTLKRIAAIQMTSKINIAENLAAASHLLKQASEMGASLAVLPENFSLFHPDPLEKVHVREKFGDGPIQSFLSAQARAHRMWIIAGTIPLETNDPAKVSAASLVFNAEGICVARYDKIHLFDAVLSASETYRESATVDAGSVDESNIQVVDTPVGKIGLTVCYDIRFPEFIRLLMERGAEIIVAPAAFTVPTGTAHWNVLARGLVAQNLCYFVGACQGGRHENGRETYGHSLIVDPWASVIAERTQDIQSEGVIVADIDREKVREARAKLPIHAHRRFEIDVKKA